MRELAANFERIRLTCDFTVSGEIRESGLDCSDGEIGGAITFSSRRSAST
jgi:hypothetical protein